jgi:hypothetical protein
LLRGSPIMQARDQCLVHSAVCKPLAQIDQERHV